MPEILVGKKMNKIKTIDLDSNSLEPTIFKLVLETSLTPEEVHKLKELGGELRYDGGLTAIIVIPPSKIEEFSQIDSIIEVI